MIKVLVAKHLGFCSGVGNAYKLALKAAHLKSPVYMLGSLVHNKKVMDEMHKNGIITIKNINDLPKDAVGTLIISAHGLPPEILEKAQHTGLKIIDTTCPWVKKPQMLAHDLCEQGYHVVIVGDKKHTEVIGLVGWSGKKAAVVSDVKEAGKVGFHDKIAVLAQTTQSNSNFEDVINVLSKKTNELKVCNTICDATSKRQRSSADVAKRSEIMLVIGDTKSANTKRLKEICEDTGAKTYLIESAEALDLNILKGFDIIGVTAGASTPSYVIDALLEKLKGAV